MVWLALSGAESTGKTTLAGDLARRLESEHGLRFNVNTGGARQAAASGLPIGAACTDETYLAILEIHTRWARMSFGKPAIWDRTPVDLLAYAFANGNGSVVLRALATELALLIASQTSVHAHVPIEFPAVDDGLRGTDEGYRQRVDQEVVRLLHAFKIPFIDVRGSRDERVEKLVPVVLAAAEKEGLCVAAPG